MSVHELATEITKIAIENKTICLNPYNYDSDEEAETQNTFNAKQIADFYKTIFKAIKSASE